MLQAILNNLWTLFLIVLTISAIIFLVIIVINIIAVTIDNFNQRKIENKALKEFEKTFLKTSNVLDEQTEKEMTDTEKNKINIDNVIK